MTASAQGRNSSLLIAIPALNEEESIKSIIERCLKARASIAARAGVTRVDITVVSDGSTDRTAEYAAQYAPDVKLIVFEKNRGYGAAIQEAWRASDADLLGFIDADGTCDPEFFADLCLLVENEHADVALGCRLNAESKMPLIRRVGNTVFALLLSFFSSERVRDTASGMRVVRRSSLPKLMPLPTGMHFTPAMSARAMLSEDLTIREKDMPYHEREGQSKLRVIRDGLRFLRVIVESAFLYRPGRPLAFLASVLALIATALMLTPTAHYLAARRVEDWMIYRFIVSQLFGAGAVLLYCASYLSTQVSRLVLLEPSRMPPPSAFARALAHKRFWALPLALAGVGSLLVLRSFIDLLTTGHTYEHWSRFVVMTFCWSSAFVLAATWTINYTLSLLAERLRYLAAQR